MRENKKKTGINNLFFLTLGWSYIKRIISENRKYGMTILDRYLEIAKYSSNPFNVTIMIEIRTKL